MFHVRADTGNEVSTKVLSTLPLQRQLAREKSLSDDVLPSITQKSLAKNQYERSNF